MCLVFLSYKQNKAYPLIILANRDEFYNRPTRPANFWNENPTILGGKDLEGGGTWMGITKNGYMAMLTNYRDIANLKTNAPTRGKLVSDFLHGEFKTKKYLLALSQTASRLNGYNLIAGTFDDPWYYSNYQQKVVRLGTGLYGLSNALLNTNWPKVEAGKLMLAPLMSKSNLDKQELLNVMTNEEVAADEKLPSTGLSLEKERKLSPMFIKTDGYGTRCTTLVTVNKKGEVEFIERSFENGKPTGDETNFTFQLS